MAIQQKTTSVLEPCPLCEAPAFFNHWRYSGAHATGMETPQPFVECSGCGLKLPPVQCDDSPYGRKTGAKSYIQARAETELRWNTRLLSVKSAARRS